MIRESRVTFLAASLQDIEERGSCQWISMGSCSTGLWITQRSGSQHGYLKLEAARTSGLC